jgi:hypothetical protein
VSVDARCKAISNSILSNLPVINGVQWRVESYLVPRTYNHGISISARFEVGPSLTDDDLYEIKNKVHQITSSGQILLELEK